ncbi:Hsp20/alpha crystallin family protein [Myxococcota bacterium]|nr:Hsp20/alpha crystallin family protein [Myxococcota bacterium]MBU1432885.1 Hsp20/alpha crystallin family protein [Myxococcota bacterium]
MNELHNQLANFYEEDARVLNQDRCWVDMQEDEQALTVHADLPGVDDEDLDITLQGEVLSISAKRQVQRPDGARAHLLERRPFEFTRSFSLPTRVDPESVRATLKDGVLTVRMDKAPEIKPRQITVNVG